MPVPILSSSSVREVSATDNSAPMPTIRTVAEIRNSGLSRAATRYCKTPAAAMPKASPTVNRYGMA